MLRPLELSDTIPEIRWHVHGLIPAGYVSTIYSPPGVGKTALAAYLAVQTVRPQGRFAGQPVRHGKVIILDADDGTGHSYNLWLNRFLGAHPDAKRELIQLWAADGEGLTPEDVKKLKEELAPDPPVLIILDAFSSAFLGVDPIKVHLVHEPLRGLTDLANETGCALLVTDHVGKQVKGQTVAEKGPLGTLAKLILPRAAFALERVPPADVDGRDVLKLECTKQSFEVKPPPLGLELVEFEDDVFDLRQFELPGEKTLEQRAEEAALELLSEAGGSLPRKELLQKIENRANVSVSTANRALRALLDRGAVERVRGSGRGRPATYTLCGTLAENAENAVTTEQFSCANPLALRNGSGGGNGAGAHGAQTEGEHPGEGEERQEPPVGGLPKRKPVGLTPPPDAICPHCGRKPGSWWRYRGRPELYCGHCQPPEPGAEVDTFKQW